MLVREPFPGRCSQRIRSIRSTATRLAAAVGIELVSTTARLAIALARPLIVLLLRKLVRNRGFWVQGLRGAWYDKVQMTSPPSSALAACAPPRVRVRFGNSMHSIPRSL